jgi:hypothetical protein
MVTSTEGRYISVITKREDIEDAVEKFFGFSPKSVDADE